MRCLAPARPHQAPLAGGSFPRAPLPTIAISSVAFIPAGAGRTAGPVAGAGTLPGCKAAHRAAAGAGSSLAALAVVPPLGKRATARARAGAAPRTTGSSGRRRRSPSWAWEGRAPPAGLSSQGSPDAGHGRVEASPVGDTWWEGPQRPRAARPDPRCWGCKMRTLHQEPEEAT